MLSFALYVPLILMLAFWGGLSVAGNVVDGRGNDQGGDSLRDFGFGALLLAGAWCAVLAVIALIQFPTTTSDGLITIAIAFAFFALLAGVLLLLSEIRVAGRPIGAYLLALVGLALVVLIVLAIL